MMYHPFIFEPEHPSNRVATTIEHAKSDGSQAYSDGFSQSDNPHGISDLFEAWSEGWYWAAECD